MRKLSRKIGGLGGETREKDGWFGSKIRKTVFFDPKRLVGKGVRKLFRRFEMEIFSKPSFFYDMTQEIRKSLLKTRNFGVFEKIEEENGRFWRWKQGKGRLVWVKNIVFRVFDPKPPAEGENLYKFSLDTLLFPLFCGTFGIRARGGDT